MSALSYPEAIVVGFIQGVSELFPVSSLGHSVIVPAIVGGSWAKDLDMTAPGSPYLDTLVAMHVATAAALVIFFRRDWVRIIGALYASIRYRKLETVDERLAWLLVVGTIPVGIAGLALDKVVREYLGKPLPTAAFLAVNGAVLLFVERMLRNRKEDAEFRAALGHSAAESDDATMVLPRVSASEITTPLRLMTPEREIDSRLSRLRWLEAIMIGACQIFALMPGFSRSGVTMAGGLLRGLRHEDAARFAFLLATPVIGAAGLLKVPELFTPEMHGSLGPAMAGSLVAGIGAYFSVSFLTKYFETRTMAPFSIYCMIAGAAAFVFFLVR
jgi:undecaprenyl-diphosphatase